MVVWGALQIAEKRREAKGKGGKERYTHLNAEFQRREWRDKKELLSEQCKEIEESNRIGKTRDLFKKTGDTKGTFHAKMGSIKDRNGKDLTEAEDIKNRWQEYTEVHEKGLNVLNNHDGMVPHLDPDILEREVKWASLLWTKLLEVIEFQSSYLKILRDDAVKVLHSIYQHIWKTQQ